MAQKGKKNLMAKKQTESMPHLYRGTSVTKKRIPLGPYRRPMPRVLLES